MNVIKSVISSGGEVVRLLKKKVTRILFLQKRQQQFPTCKLNDSCKVIESQLGTHVVVHGNVVIQESSVGDHSYIAKGSSVSHCQIGRYCSIGEHISVGLWRHPAKTFVSTYPAFFALDNLGCCESFVSKNCYDESPRKTIIGHDVWIGNNVLIPGGISIGTGAIIAAGSVVTKDVPPYAIVGGNPADIIRYRFEKDEVSFLLKTAWWKWSGNDIVDLAELFKDISAFRSAVKSRSVVQG